MTIRRWAGLASLLLAAPALSAESPAVFLPADQPATNIVGTAFGPQPNACWSETHEPLAPLTPLPPRFSASAEYLLWQFKPGDVAVPLVTSTTVPNPDIFTNTGRLGEPGTIILGGNQDLNWGTANGIRFSVGYGLTPDVRYTVEAIGLIFERRRDINVFNSTDDGSPVLSIPFFRVNPGVEGEGRFIVAFPANFAGQIYYDASSQLWGAELNLGMNDLTNRALGFGWRFDLLGGVRYLGLEETFTFGSRSTTLGDQFITTFGGEDVNGIGVVVGSYDRFETGNRFWGPQLGARAEYNFGRFFVAGTAKVALGITQQVLDIDGYSFLIRQPGAATETLPGGFFASPTNSGRTVSNEFSVVPEVTFNFGFQLTECARVSVGYTFLYWTNVLRPADQLDRNLNTSYLPLAEFYGQTAVPRLPQATGKQADFWAHGVTFALEVRF